MSQYLGFVVGNVDMKQDFSATHGASSDGESLALNAINREIIHKKY